MSVCLEWDCLHMGMAAFAYQLYPVKSDGAQAAAKTQMPQGHCPVTIDMHLFSTCRTAAVRWLHVKSTFKQKHFPAGSGLAGFCLAVVESG